MFSLSINFVVAMLHFCHHLLFTKLPLMPLLLVLVYGSTEKLPMHSPAAPPFVPFFQVWTIGKVWNDIELITSSHMRYTVSSGTLPCALPLHNATTVSLADMFNSNSDLVQETLKYGIIVRHVVSTGEQQHFWRFSVDGSRTAEQEYIFNLNTKTVYTSTFIMESNFTDNQVWLSSVDEDAFFRLYRKQVTPSQESILMAKYQIDWKNDNAKKQPDLADLQIKSNFCTICLKTPRKHDRGIFLTMGHCTYPVQWRVVSGFVAEQYFFLFGNDQVYVFENYLFEQLGQSGHFMQMDFGDFFWKTSDKGRGHSILATVILVLLVITATVFLLTVIGVFFKHYKSQSSDNKNESEKTLRDESRLRGLLKNNDALKNKIKAISRKPVAGGTSVIKMTSALLPTARESQKDSLKTNWTEETGVPSVTTQRLKRSYSQAKSNGKMSLPTSKYKWKVTKSGSKSKQKRVPRVRSQSSSFARWKVFKKTGQAKRSVKSTKKERSINKRL